MTPHRPPAEVLARDLLEARARVEEFASSWEDPDSVECWVPEAREARVRLLAALEEYAVTVERLACGVIAEVAENADARLLSIEREVER